MARDGRRPDTPFWVEPGRVRGERLVLDQEESHHLLKVHRAAPGTAFEAVDGEGTLYRCVVEAIERRAVVGRIDARERETGELAGAIHLLLGTPDFAAAEEVSPVLCLWVRPPSNSFPPSGASRGAPRTSGLPDSPGWRAPP